MSWKITSVPFSRRLNDCRRAVPGVPTPTGFTMHDAVFAHGFAAGLHGFQISLQKVKDVEKPFMANTAGSSAAWKAVSGVRPTCLDYASD